MKTIIAGSRDITDVELVESIIERVHADFPITEVICGCCRGVDILGATWAEKKGLPIHFMPANWKLHGPPAGPIRNRHMVEIADMLIVIRYLSSKGSRDVLMRSKSKGIRLYDFVQKEIKSG